jgi:hypothetical protein
VQTSAFAKKEQDSILRACNFFVAAPAINFNSTPGSIDAPIILIQRLVLANKHSRNYTRQRFYMYRRLTLAAISEISRR